MHTLFNSIYPMSTLVQVEGLRQSFDLNFTGYSIGTTVVFGYSFLIASFVIFIVKEKETKVKSYIVALFLQTYLITSFVYI